MLCKSLDLWNPWQFIPGWDFLSSKCNPLQPSTSLMRTKGSGLISFGILNFGYSSHCVNINCIHIFFFLRAVFIRKSLGLYSKIEVTFNKSWLSSGIKMNGTNGVFLLSRIFWVQCSWKECRTTSGFILIALTVLRV